MKVRDVGFPNAKIVLVGEAPGASEEQKGVPFCGASGHLLRNMLLNSGLMFEQCYVTNVVDVRPPGNDFGVFYLDAKRQNPTPLLIGYQEKLREKIYNMQPSVVVALGKEAMKALTNKYSMKTWNGSVIKNLGTKIIPTYHPASVLRTYEQRPICELALSRAAEILKGVFKEDPVKMLVVPKTCQEVIAWLDKCLDEAQRISYDIETTMVWYIIRTFGLAYRDKSNTIQALSIPLAKRETGVRMVGKTISVPVTNQSYWTPTDEVRILTKLQEVLGSKIPKVGQNAISFDQPIIEEQLGLRVANFYMDTMHAHHLCYVEFPMSLDFMTIMYTNYSNYWTGKDSSNLESLSRYNCMDCASTLVCSEKLDTELEMLGMKNFYHDHLHPLAFAVARMSEYGVAYDHKKAEELKKSYESRLKEIENWFANKVGYKINLKSPKQLKEYLYDKEKFPVQKKMGAITTDAEALKKLLHRYPNEELLQRLLEHRKISKLVSTYLSVKFDGDGIMRASFNPSGTDSGRLSSSSTYRNTGANLQNIPLDIRELYRAREGCVLIKGDLAQAETLVVAELVGKHGDRTLVERYKNPEFDIHTWSAAGIYGTKEDAITKDQRSLGKLSNHSGNYGAGPNVLVSQSIKRDISIDGSFGITYGQAKAIIESRHKQIPGLRRWWKAVETQLSKTRRLSNVFGRVRTFFGRLDATTYRVGYSFEPQSTVGDLTNYILRRLDGKLPYGCRVVLQVHDEIVIECPEALVEECIACFRRCAWIPMFFNDWKDPLVIPIDISVGKTWGSCKAVD